MKESGKEAWEIPGGSECICGESCSKVTDRSGQRSGNLFVIPRKHRWSGEGCVRWAGFGAPIIRSGHSKDIAPRSRLTDAPVLTSLRPHGMWELIWESSVVTR